MRVPAQVTYSSDYFEELHALAVQLIRSGNAYVCHQTADEIKDFRRSPIPPPDSPKACRSPLQCREVLSAEGVPARNVGARGSVFMTNCTGL